MSVLVIAEHDNASIKGATLNTVTAAAQAVITRPMSSAPTSAALCCGLVDEIITS